MRGLLSGGDITSTVLYNYYRVTNNHACYWGSRGAILQFFVIGEAGAILQIAEEKRIQKHEKMLESQVLVATPQRKANCELCARVGVRGFSPGKIFINSRPISANFFNGKCPLPSSLFHP